MNTPNTGFYADSAPVNLALAIERRDTLRSLPWVDPGNVVYWQRAVDNWSGAVAKALRTPHDPTGPVIVNDAMVCATCGAGVHIYSPDFDSATLYHGGPSAS